MELFLHLSIHVVHQSLVNVIYLFNSRFAPLVISFQAGCGGSIDSLIHFIHPPLACFEINFNLLFKPTVIGN